MRSRRGVLILVLLFVLVSVGGGDELGTTGTRGQWVVQDLTDPTTRAHFTELELCGLDFASNNDTATLRDVFSRGGKCHHSPALEAQCHLAPQYKGCAPTVTAATHLRRWQPSSGTPLPPPTSILDRLVRRLHAAGMFGLVFLGDSTVGQDYLHAFHCPVARLSGDRRGMDPLPRPFGSSRIWLKSSTRKGTGLGRDMAQVLEAAFGEDNCMFYKRPPKGRSIPELPNGPSKEKCRSKNKRFLRIEKAEKLCVSSVENQEAGRPSLARSGNETCIGMMFLAGKLSDPDVLSNVVEVLKKFVPGGLGSAVLVFNEGVHVHANGERAAASLCLDISMQQRQNPFICSFFALLVTPGVEDHMVRLSPLLSEVAKFLSSREGESSIGIWRETYTQHFMYVGPKSEMMPWRGDGSFDHRFFNPHDETGGRKVEELLRTQSRNKSVRCIPSVTSTDPREVAVLERLASTSSLRSWKVLRTFDFTAGRGDLHFGIGPEKGGDVLVDGKATGEWRSGRIDCTHSCYSPFRAEPLLWRVGRVVDIALGGVAGG